MQTFSALGLLPDNSYKPLTSRIPAPLLKSSQWLSVPGAYFDDPSMVQILVPIFASSAITTAVGTLYLGGMIDTVAAVDNVAAVNDVSVQSALLPIQATSAALLTYITALLNNQISLNGDISSFTTSISESTWFTSLVNFLKDVDQENFFNNLVNAISVLVIIRMSKLIGNDRDSIIAEKVQAAAKEFPVSSTNSFFLVSSVSLFCFVD